MLGIKDKTLCVEVEHLTSELFSYDLDLGILYLRLLSSWNYWQAVPCPTLHMFKWRPQVFWQNC